MILRSIILFFLSLNFVLCGWGQGQKQDVAPQVIPDDFTYDLIADRLTCIENIVPLHFNESVYSFVNYFTVKNREYTNGVIKRASKYFPIFEKYLKKYNIPEELKYLAIVESGLRPQVLSRVGAGGLWQFMPYTGRSFKLHQDWYIDERFDPHQATEAACKYLKQLYNMFGDWELALAAYNSGPGNVRKAIRRSGYKKKFWEVYRYLPRETRSYLPQFVAVTYAMSYSAEHNLFHEAPEYFMEHDTIMIKDFVNLKTLAKELDVCYEDIKSLNSSLIRYGVKSELAYPIKIPQDKKELYTTKRSVILANAKEGQKALEYKARNSTGSTYGRDKIAYRVRSGDVLGKIAQRYNVRVSDIRKWNKISGNLIRVGQRLDIWLYPSSASRAASVTKAKPKKPVILNIEGKKVYMVQPGDTLWDISKMHEGLTIEKIKKLNNLTSNKITPGQKLIIG